MTVQLSADRESKVCPKCGIPKSRSEFSIRKSGPRIGHMTAHCKKCDVATNRARKVRDPTVYRRCEWPSKLKRYYGITVADYDRILAEQGGGCAICGTTDPNVGNRKYRLQSRSVFDVDHCHKTGVVRGLLCTRCNRLVGLAADDLTTAKRLIHYLTK